MPSCRSSVRAVAVLALLSCLFAIPLGAQTYTPTLPDNSLSPADPIGVPPQPSKAGTHEAVSNTNGGLSFFLPVLSLPQRGGWNLTLGLYNVSPNFTTRSDSSTTITNRGGGAPALTTITYTNGILLAAAGGPLNWNLPNLRASIEYAGQVNDCIGCKNPTYVPVVCITNWVFTDWSGNQHPFTNTTECSSIDFQQTAQVTDSSDGSWLRLDTTNYHSNITVRTKDGTTYNFPGWSTSGDPFASCNDPSCGTTASTQESFYNQTFSSIVDNTGQNTITYSGSTLTDTIGRTIVFGRSGGNSSLSYTDSNGNQQTISVNLTQQSPQNYNFNLTCSPGKSYPNVTVTEDYGSTSFNQSPLTYTVTLPAVNGVSRVYTLQMDGVGDLLQINYPAGGYTKYDYQDLGFYHVANIQACSRTERQVAHKRECPFSSGCSSSQELVTTYTPTADGSYPFNDSMAVQDAVGDVTYVQNQNLSSTSDFTAPHEISKKIFPPGQYPNGAPLRTIQTTYTPYIAGVDVQVPASVTTTLNDVSLSAVTNYQYEAVTMSFSCFSGCGPSASVAIDNPTEIDEYDYGASSPAKETAQNWMSSSDGTLYDIAQGHILDRLKSRVVTDPVTNVEERLNYGYNSVGDIILKTIGGTGVSSLNTSYQRDSYGNITQMTDPKRNVTNFGYTNNWANPGCAISGSSAYLTSVTDALGHVAKFSYYPCTGLKASAQDPNDLAADRAGTTFAYDALGRPTNINYPDGGSTNYTYVDAAPNSVTQSSAISSGANRVDKTTVDGFGRTIETNLADPDCATGDETDTTYDSLGRILTVSNPYCTTSDPTYGVTSYAYDALNRTTQITNPDNSVVTTSYLGRATEVTDESGKQRITQTDALGRLTAACEITSTALSVGISGSTTPTSCGLDLSGTGFPTSYGYDAFGDLTSVTQGPLNPRSFSYNALGELTSATNPESGTTTYTYDLDGNLATKTDARAITITYAYDALNRLTGKTYSDSTPPVTYNYDESSAHGVNLTNTVGRLSSESTAGAYPTFSVFGYDAMGRITINTQQAIQYPQSPSYTYDLLGNTTTQTVPAGGTITNMYNGASRLSASTTNFAGPYGGVPTNLLSGIHYNALGDTTAQAIGNGVNESWTYDDRGRVSSFSASNGSTTAYSYSLSYFPNGDVMSSNDSVNGGWVFGYDDMNRLDSATESGQIHNNPATFAYLVDRLGNRWDQNVTSGSGPTSSLAFDADNHITASGVTYDAAGDVTYDGTNTYTYDAEGRIATVPSLGTTYVYDAEGRRVAVVSSTIASCDSYDLQGHVILQYVCWNGAGRQRTEYWIGGRHLVTYSSWPFFNHADWLGTDRYKTTPSGGQYGYCVSDPFGDNQWCPEADGDISPVHFTGKERDGSNTLSPTNLDNFGARYYSSAMGRFMTPDWAAKPTAVPYASFGNPQSLNLYSYVKNNPVTTRDPDGHCDSPGGVCAFFTTMALGAKAMFTFDRGAAQQHDQMLAGFESAHPIVKSIDNAVKEFENSPAALVAGPAGEAGALTKGAAALADDALVVRGGVATAEQLTKGAETVAADGKLSGISVQSANGASVSELSSGLKNNQVSVTTAGEIRATGAEVKPTPTPGNPNHCELCNVDANKVSQTFKQQLNPAKIPQ